MLVAAGLRLDQSPSIAVPYRFFATAPWYLVASGLIPLFFGDPLASRWTPGALACTHLIAIGYLAQVMVGAAYQMLPVLVGSGISRVGPHSLSVWTLLNLGPPVMAFGFLGGDHTWVAVGGGAAALAFTMFIVSAAHALWRMERLAATGYGIALALASLALAVGVGLSMAAFLAGWIPSSGLQALVRAHVTLALLGWVGILLATISLKLVPMFFVTNEYPRLLGRWLVPTIFAALIASAAADIIGWSAAALLVPAVAGFAAFAGTTAWLLSRRRRRTPDPSLFFWGVAIASILIGAMLWAIGEHAVAVGLLLLVGVGFFAPSGMLAKIVPFLAWLHLQSRPRPKGHRIPHIHAFGSEKLVRTSGWAGLSALGLLVWGSFGAPFAAATAGGVLLATAGILQGALVLRAILRYRTETKRLSP